MFKTSLFLLMFCGSLCALDIRIDNQDYDSLPTKSGEYDAILMNQKGNLSESKVSFNSATGTLSVPGIESAENSSVFVPDLDARYLYNNGNWINPQGNYWNGTKFVQSSDPGWQGHWNDYWHKNWKNQWNPYWNNHKNDANWRWKDQPHWRGHWHKHAKYHRHHRDHRNHEHKHHGEHKSHETHHHSVHHHTHHHSHK